VGAVRYYSSDVAKCKELGHHLRVAAIPARAESYFLEGESQRGGTQVNCWSKGREVGRTLQDKIGTCKYAKLIGKQRVAKRNQHIAEAVDGKHRSKIAHNESIKRSVTTGSPSKSTVTT
jgi:hypothetical protein